MDYAEGKVTIVGDGSTKEFEVKVKHGLASDKLVVKLKVRPITKAPSYLFSYLSDEDDDGFYETLVITAKFNVPPAKGEKLTIHWKTTIAG